MGFITVISDDGLISVAYRFLVMAPPSNLSVTYQPPKNWSGSTRMSHNVSLFLLDVCRISVNSGENLFFNYLRQFFFWKRKKTDN